MTWWTEICRPYGDNEGMGRDNAGDDGRVCRHAHYSGKDSQTGSVAFKCQVLWFLKRICLYYTRDQKYHPAVEHFRPLDYSRAFSDRFLYTLYDDDDAAAAAAAPFQHSTKQGYDTKRSQSWNAKGKRGGRDVVDNSAFCVFCEDENFKHTEREMGI